MIKLNPMDGGPKVRLYPKTDMLDLLHESEAAAMNMKYIHDLRCFCNYLIAHYDGHWNMSNTKFYVHYPLVEL